MRAVERRVPGEAAFPCHQQRIGILVDLRQAERVRRDRPVDQRITREAPVGLLGPVEQEPDHGPGARHVPVGQQPGEGLVAVPGEYLAVRPPGMRGRRGYRLAPRIGTTLPSLAAWRRRCYT